ncbi:MAG: ATP-dependent 6-phosphofructokinase [Candidatus Heimdallarchaeota archaeon]|nr:ATP-dependent 6-phosphofructokinase [Candidatus Heimdallarchaeota archaeon]MDH5644853.1 ATP-dependent 6-phosphofructokinase [Candidatus Heimdallarchaeota archaeon]
MKIGILTSGGDTPGMNAVIRAAYIKCKLLGHELIGFKNGWKGLLENITVDITDQILDQIDLGGTILGSGRTNPLKIDNGLELIKETINNNGIECVVAIGGEDTLGVANKLTNEGFPMIGVPKTIDNDLAATDYTFGFNTAITIATEAMDRLSTTAKSHDRVIVVEVMGRHAGWMTLHSGIATGAHVILIPEYQISFEQMSNLIKKRYSEGNTWGIIAVSEGYGFEDTENVDAETDEFGHVRLEKLEIGKQIAERLTKTLNIPTRAITLGHVQRGGSPTTFDRVLSTQLGLKAIELSNDKKFGMMPALKGTKIQSVALSDAVSKLKIVDEESWQVARDIMGI